MNLANLTSLKKNIGWAAAGVGALMIANAIFREATRFSLRGKVVLVTGGTRGLGLVLARELSKKGARLAICSRNADKVEIARQELERSGAEVHASAVDLTDQKQVDAMIKDVVNHYGRIDVLINNAGIIQVGPSSTMTIKDYEEAMQTNFFAPLYCIQAAVPHFKKQGEGRIVNITSIGGIISVPHLLPYSASKFALVGLSEGLNAELKKENIHVTTIVPSLMRTGSPRNITVKGNHEAEYKWFKRAASSPLLALQAETAARSIISSLEHREEKSILSLTGKLATVVKGVAPGWIGLALTIANKLLPEPVQGTTESKKGFELESSGDGTGRESDQAALRNNEM